MDSFLQQMHNILLPQCIVFYYKTHHPLKNHSLQDRPFAGEKRKKKKNCFIIYLFRSSVEIFEEKDAKISEVEWNLIEKEKIKQTATPKYKQKQSNKQE
jgi:hypothetical protein